MQAEPVRVVAIALRDFRSYGHAQLSLGDGLTVVAGANGAGKTNMLEALYFGCTARSCRTTNDRALVRWGALSTRVEVEFEAQDGPHRASVGFAPGQPKRIEVDGARLERMAEAPVRPLVSVFLPDRLELIKGPAAVRRAHLDQVVTALWPVRARHRQAYAQALAQRNALISRVAGGRASGVSMSSWNAQLACHGIELMHDREQALTAVAATCSSLGEALGLGAELTLSYRPRSKADGVQQLAQELEARTEDDLRRGFTTHGPHRDEICITLGGRELRTFGSQGQQRAALLALLLAEREAISRLRGTAPVMLLDDVMSELDHPRRVAIVDLLRQGSQSLITTTDLDHVPGWEGGDVVRATVSDAQISLDTATGARFPEGSTDPGFVLATGDG